MVIGRTTALFNGAAVVVAAIAAAGASAAHAGPNNETFVMTTYGQSNYSVYHAPDPPYYNFSAGSGIPANADSDTTALAGDGISGFWRVTDSATALTDSAAVSGSGVSGFGAWTYSGSTTVSAQSGQLKSGSTAAYMGSGDNGTVNTAESYGIMRETLTVNSPGVSLGSNGTMLIELSIDGGYNVTGRGTAGMLFRYGYGGVGSAAIVPNRTLLESFADIYGNGYQLYGPHSSAGSYTTPAGFNLTVGPSDANGSPSFIDFSGSGKVYATIPISFSSGFDYELGLYTFTGMGSGGGVLTSDFSNTAQVTGIQIFDGSGSELTDFTISSGSGTLYDANGVHLTSAAAAPEPGSLTLAACGSLGVISLLRYRRSRGGSVQGAHRERPGRD